MAHRTALIEVTPGQRRIALVEGVRLYDLMVDRPGRESVTGNIYLGRVERILPSIQAAFVGIGLERSGFLGLAEARPSIHRDENRTGTEGITDYVSEGDAVLVQALNDPVSDKGAKVTTRITLPGRFLVYTPGQVGIRMSRRLAAEGKGDPIESMVSKLARDDEGFIVRSRAGNATEESLTDDIDTLRATWETITEARKTARPIACLHRDLDPVERLLRDEAGPELGRIVVDNAEILAELRAVCSRLSPGLVDRLKMHSAGTALFDAYEIESQIDDALAPIVTLPSGGSIVIEETTALTAIDVNTGGRSVSGGPERAALDANLAAIAEIARHIRLRNLGGLVVVDFVSMRRQDNRHAVIDALREAVSSDSCPVHIAGFTRFGLVEMTRERRRASLSESLLAPCPACTGAGRIKSPQTVAYDALRHIQRQASVLPATPLTVTASSCVIEVLKNLNHETLAKVEEQTGWPVDLISDDSLAADHFQVQSRGEVGETDG
jgi:ribonuclease G